MMIGGGVALGRGAADETSARINVNTIDSIQPAKPDSLLRRVLSDGYNDHPAAQFDAALIGSYRARHYHRTMKRIFSLLAVVALALAAGSRSYASPQPAADETQKTNASVMAVELHWTQAEVHGDVAYIDRLLLPEYRSVNANGVAHPKSAILAGARKNGRSGEAAQRVAAYFKAHPYETRITIQGDTAVCTFYSPALGLTKGIKSSDILVYLNGGWHAIYSAHTSVP
jgi:hypothetical protein